HEIRDEVEHLLLPLGQRHRPYPPSPYFRRIKSEKQGGTSAGSRRTIGQRSQMIWNAPSSSSRYPRSSGGSPLSPSLSSSALSPWALLAWAHGGPRDRSSCMPSGSSSWLGRITF